MVHDNPVPRGAALQGSNRQVRVCGLRRTKPSGMGKRWDLNLMVVNIRTWFEPDHLKAFRLDHIAQMAWMFPADKDNRSTFGSECSGQGQAAHDMAGADLLGSVNADGYVHFRD
jgi:hypothetical protein